MRIQETAVWRLIALLTIVNGGAALGDEGSNQGAHYFWDLASYVTALDADNPYQSDAVFPFLYPPAAADLFTLARSHLFELMSIAYVAAVALFLHALAALDVPRRFEWVCAITSMGGLGVVSLATGNVAIAMNFTLLAAMLHAASGSTVALRLLAPTIAAGALIKPQFVLYAGLLLVLERSWRAAVAKVLVVGGFVAGVHGLYRWLQPARWNAYVESVLERTTEVKDFGWGPAAFAMLFDQSNAAAALAYTAALAGAAALAYLTWRGSQSDGEPIPPVVLAGLAFVVLTFANPRVPLYDLYAAGIALSICCAASDRRTTLVWVLGVALAVNLLPWTIDNFARAPMAQPWWLRHLLLTHLLGLFGLFAALAWAGVRRSRTA
jgi:hypothetical protein